ncbi:hypothetical protein SAMN05421786_10251 [Chryseobacterium ureilyticum]|uniref:Glycosyltransferase 2-like domain-containing protein n=1 Tax=Chryseobacterium ureilyticum TaxID=373668 RepID=A0A1N7LWR8_9FLAO|nr:glycosyltransferase family 2 protein [Chryseobacterium ureilyticum]SIS78276.1 hypothetical protein SAMN05421786_10251 [Chryseobacterium ureilyticum]
MVFSASIVLYRSNYSEIKKLVDHIFFYTKNIELYLIDNSPTNELGKLKNEYFQFPLHYFHTPENKGFGAGHNLAITKALELNSKYHFVINPDIILNEDAINPMIEYMESHDDIGMMMPKVLNTDLSKQNLPKLLPSPIDILLRKLKKPDFIYNSFINKYELRFVEDDRIYEAPVLSGCFTLFRCDALKKKGMYDDAFFMYFEDWDISRRINQSYKTIVFQPASVIHEYESGANKSKHLFKIFVKSCIHYFNKYGWLFDSERREINKKTLKQFK